MLSLIRQNPKRAEVLEDMAALPRPADNRGLTTLEREIELCRRYPTSSRRLGDRLKVSG